MKAITMFPCKVAKRAKREDTQEKNTSFFTYGPTHIKLSFKLNVEATQSKTTFTYNAWLKFYLEKKFFPFLSFFLEFLHFLICRTTSWNTCSTLMLFSAELSMNRHSCSVAKSFASCLLTILSCFKSILFPTKATHVKPPGVFIFFTSRVNFTNCFAVSKLIRSVME